MQIKSRILTCALALPIANAAAAELKYENGNGGSVLFYGQLNPAYQSFDDGETTTDTIVDSAHSNSRVGFWLRQDFGANEFAFNFETGLGFRLSSAVSQTFSADTLDWDRTDIRKVDFSYKTDRYGTFYAGQGSTATDGVAEVDLSGTALVNYVSVSDTAALFRFRNADGTLSTKTIAGSFGDFDGGRRGRLRYDTPNFSGFTLSVSWGQEILVENSELESASIALKYGGEFGDFRVQAALGYSEIDPGPQLADFNDRIGSVSVLHNSGVSVTLAAGNRSTSGDYGYVKLGYQGNWFSIGKTAMAVDYYQGNDRSSEGAEATAVGFGVVQAIDRANLEVYLGYRSYELTETAASYQDASSVLFGTRWKF